MNTAAALLEQVRARRWFYEFELPDGTCTRTDLPPGIGSIHTTRREMLDRALAYALGGTDPATLTAVDLACHQGWFALHLARRGFREVRHPLVTHNAVDYPFDFENLAMLLEHFPAADVVVAARRSYPGVSRSRELASQINRILLRLGFGLQFEDAGVHRFVLLFGCGCDTLSNAASVNLTRGS